MENWKAAPDRPGYRCKTIQRGNATITIYRPELDAAEAARANDKARAALENAMRAYYGRQARTAAC